MKHSMPSILFKLNSVLGCNLLQTKLLDLHLFITHPWSPCSIPSHPAPHPAAIKKLVRWLDTNPESCCEGCLVLGLQNNQQQLPRTKLRILLILRLSVQARPPCSNALPATPSMAQWPCCHLTCSIPLQHLNCCCEAHGHPCPHL